MEDLARKALDWALGAGVEYADVRAVETRSQDLATRDGRVAQAEDSESAGIAVRVHAGGGWGFAATDDLSVAGLEKAVQKARAIAAASALTARGPIRLAPEPVHRAVWVSHCAIDPLALSVETKLAHLLAVDAALRENKAVTLSETSFHSTRTRQWFLSSEGSAIDQTRTFTGAGCVCHVFKNGDLQKRSYPNSFGGQYQLRGYELVHELDLLGNAPRIAEEAVALHSADQCPEGDFTVILDSSQLGLQIHESIGHPIELDRVLGSEANYAGMSFLTLDKLNTCATDRISSTWSATRAPNTVPASAPSPSTTKACPRSATRHHRAAVHRLHDFARDRAGRREDRSNGTMRADGWARIPLIRMTNVSLLPANSRSTRSSTSPTPSTWRPTRAGPSTTSATTSNSAARSLGDPQRRARPHAEEPQLQRHQHRVLELLRSHRATASR
jgi:TldD protein